MKLLGWKIVYDDLSVYDSRNVSWCDTPFDGVYAVVQFYDELRPDGEPIRDLSVSGYDIYFHAIGDDGEPIIGGMRESRDPRDPFNSPLEVYTRYNDAVLKRGRWTSIKRLYECDELVNSLRWNS